MKTASEDLKDLAWPVTRADCLLLIASVIVMVVGTGALAAWSLVELVSLN